MTTCRLLLAVQLALAMLVARVDAVEVIATRLDGTMVAGEFQSWDDNHVVLVTGDGEQQIAIEQLLSLRQSREDATQPRDQQPASPHVELIDGTLLPIDDFTSAGLKATAVVAAALPSGDKEVTVTRRQLAAVRLLPLDTQAAAQWEEIRALNLASDVLVVMKRGGQSLDHVEGVLGDVSQDKVGLKYDGKPMQIDRAKLAGLIYYRGPQRAAPDAQCIIHGQGGLRAHVSHAELARDVVRMTTISGVHFSWPLDDIEWADFSAGKLVYLSDLEPALERWTPLVALPAGAELAAEYGKPRRDQSAYGGPLTLHLTESSPASPLDQLRPFRKGLALRSRTEIAYRLSAGYRRFTATAGIDPATSASGNVRLKIYGDGEGPLLDANISGDEPPRPIDLDIAGVKRLKIVVDYGRNLDTGDWLNLCEARIVK